MTSRTSLVGATLLVLVFFLGGPVTVADAQIGESVTVTIDPATANVVLGDNLDLRVVVTNNGSETAPPLVVHLDITDPNQSTSVDPEDWTATLSKPIGAIPAGETATVEWTIQPISGGTFATYAVVLSAGADSVAASNVLQVTVADQRTLNPGGILPVAIGAPIIVGTLLVAQLRAARRTTKQDASSALTYN